MSEEEKERIKSEFPCWLLVHAFLLVPRILRSWLHSRCVFFGETRRDDGYEFVFQLGGNWVILEENDVI